MYLQQIRFAYWQEIAFGNSMRTKCVIFFLVKKKHLFQDGLNDNLIILGVVMMKEMTWLRLIHCESMLAWCKWMKTEEKGFDAVLIVCALALSSSVFSHRHPHFYGSCWTLQARWYGHRLSQFFALLRQVESSLDKLGQAGKSLDKLRQWHEWRWWAKKYPERWLRGESIAIKEILACLDWVVQNLNLR